MSERVYRLGLIGYPLEHSLSPVLHRAALTALGWTGEYRLYPIPSHRFSKEFPHLVAALQEGELDGLNVTLPHKQRVLPWVERLSPEARACAAVNTLVPGPTGLEGHNTDVPGFWWDVQQQLPLAQFSRWRGLVLGAGGAARAVAYALARQGWPVHVVARRFQQAQSLSTDLQAQSLTQVYAHPWEALTDLRQPWWQADEPVLVVNATPVGMHPHTRASPWPPGTPWPRGAVYDLVYNPRETRFVRQAREAGLPAVGGLGMLVAQAAYAFHLWTRAPLEQIFPAMAQAVGLSPLYGR